MVEVVANLHVHSQLSDGAWGYREIVRAALRAGLQALAFTDHNVHVRGVEGYMDGLLVLVGEEVHDTQRRPQANHCLIYGADAEMSPFADAPSALIREAARRDALAFFAHPVEFSSPLSPDYGAIPWVSWEVRGNTGIELWNYMTEFKARLRNWPIAFMAALFPSWFIFSPFKEALHRWDALLREGRQMVGIGNADAHGEVFSFGPFRKAVFSYEYLFRCVNTHLLLDHPLSGEFAADKAALLSALRRGRAFVGYDLPAPTRGFRFFARSGAAQAQMGDTLERAGAVRFSVRTPGAGWIRLLRDGCVVAQRLGRGLEHVSADRGVYRVEVRRFFRGWWRGWIYSNPIYVY